jgi:hypothetical protein
MRLLRPALLIALVFGLILTATAQQHPRVFFTPQRLTLLRAEIAQNGSTRQQIYNLIKARVDKKNFEEYTRDGEYRPFARSYYALSVAAVYAISGEASYAQQAFSALEDIYNHTDSVKVTPLAPANKGLEAATMGRCFGLAYDWCYGGWNETQRAWVKTKLDEMLNYWATMKYNNRGGLWASNWVAVCEGTELFTMLAAGQESTRAERYSAIKEHLKLHIENGYGPLGVGQEGIGYTGYGGISLLPALLALRDVNDATLEQAMNQTQWWKMAMYAGSNVDYPANHRWAGWTNYLGNGVDGPKTNDEGWLNLVLGTVPTESMGHFKYFYDRCEGPLSPGPDAWKYSPRCAGDVWALLYYPQSTTPVDPNPTFAKSIADEEKGLYFFRNQWKDTNDICFSVSGDFQHHDNAWDEADAFQINLIAFNTVFFSSPKKTRKANNFSSLLVNGAAMMNSSQLGAKKFYEPRPQGGYVIVDGGQKYRFLGCSFAQRHVLVDFSATAAPALISTLDKLDSYSQNSYTWNLNLGDTEENPYDLGTLITKTQGTESGRPYFLLRGRSNSYVKGWVLSHPQATIAAGDPLAVTVTGQKTDIWIVMAVGAGTPPTATISGEGLGSKLQLNGSTIAFNHSQQRIVSGVADTQRPAAPTQLAAASVSDHSVSLTWQAPNDGDLSHYRLYRSTQPNTPASAATLIVDNIAAPSFGDIDLAAQTKYYYKVVAVDSWNNQSSASAEISAQTSGDTRPPSIATTRSLSQTTITLTFSEKVTAASAQKIANYRFTPALSITSITAPDSAYQIVLTVAPMSEGQEYLLKISGVEDISGNRSQDSARVVWFSGVRIVDSFESYPLGSIHGNGQGGDGWLAPWSGNATIVDVSAKPLVAAGLWGGNKAITIPSASAVTRLFNQQYDLSQVNGKELYISWLCRIDLKDPTKLPTTGNLWLYNTKDKPDWGFGGIIMSPDRGDYVVSQNLSLNAAGGPEVAFDQAALVVMRVGKRSMDLWVNPTSTAAAPTLSYQNNAKGKDFSFSAFPGIGITSKYDMKSSPIKQMLIDRIVIGESFASAISGTLNQTVSAQPRVQHLRTGSAALNIRRSAAGMVVENLPVNTRVQLLTLQGKSILATTQRSAGPLAIPQNRAPGLYLLHITLPDGTAITRSIVRQP